MGKFRTFSRYRLRPLSDMKNAWFMDSCASNRIPDLCLYAGAQAFGRFSAREAPSNNLPRRIGQALHDAYEGELDFQDRKGEEPFSLLRNSVAYGNKKRILQGFPGDSLTMGSPNEAARQAILGA